MKMKKIYYIFTLLLGLVSLTACVPEVDDAFDKSASERAQEAINNTREILKAPANGWRMEYYGATSYGGYNVFMKFEDDSVTVASEKVGASHNAGVDKNGNIITAKSHMKIEQSQGVVISLDVYNDVFHYFSNPVNADYGTSGEGFDGDFEFRVASISADKIELIGKKHDTKIMMYPMDENTSWADYIKQVDETSEYMASRSYTLEEEGSDKSYSATTSLRCLRFITTDETGKAVAVLAPFVVTPDGYKLYEKTTVGGIELTGFSKGETRDYFCSVDNPNVKLVTEVPTLYETLTRSFWYLTYEDMGTYGKPQWDVMLHKLATNNKGKVERVYYAGIGYVNSSWMGFQMSTAVESSIVKGMTFSKVKEGDKVYDDRVTIAVNNAQNSGNRVGDRYYKNNGLKEAMEPFCGTRGRTFVISADNLRHPTYLILTDVNEPTNVIKLWAGSKIYPFGDLDKTDDN